MLAVDRPATASTRAWDSGRDAACRSTGCRLPIPIGRIAPTTAATPRACRARAGHRAPPSSRGSKARGTAAGRFSSTPPAAATPAAGRSGSTCRRREQLRLVFESPGPYTLNKPDNLAVSPRGGLAICEDGFGAPQRIHGMTRDGRLFPFIRNNAVLNGERHGFRGDFRDDRVHRRDLQSRRSVDVLQHPDAGDDLCGDRAVGAGETLSCGLRMTNYEIGD